MVLVVIVFRIKLTELCHNSNNYLLKIFSLIKRLIVHLVLFFLTFLSLPPYPAKILRSYAYLRRYNIEVKLNLDQIPNAMKIGTYVCVNDVWYVV